MNIYCNDYVNLRNIGPVDLWICDPPYGDIIKDEYDNVYDLEYKLIDLLVWMAGNSNDGTSAYIFGGTGKYKNRPFIKFASKLEECTNWRIHNWITWAKRKGYGTQKNWMYAREECLFLVYNSKFPSYFNVPYRDEERDEAWKKRLSKQEKYQPKTNKYRYSNVIYDINELFRNKFVTAEKPEKLYKLLIETSCKSDGFVVDPMCGSGTTGVVIEKYFPEMKYLLIEKDPETYNIAIERLRSVNTLSR